jgi:hypothetical protein
MPLTDMNENEKKQKFKKSIEKFKTFALPSFPVTNDKINLQLDTRHFSVTLEPKFDDAHKALIEEVSDQIIKSGDTARIPRDKIAMMVAVNFYFDYGLDWYQDLEECKKAYDKLQASGKTLHLAEGTADNWSTFPEIEIGKN